MKKFVLMLCLCLAWAVPAWAQPVTAVQVAVRDRRGGTSAQLLSKMAESMQVVAQQMFQGKGTEKIAGDIPGYEKLLGEVADRVLTGYTTEKVQLLPGTTTSVTFTIVPWSNVIHNPAIDLQFSGVSPVMAAYLQEKLPGLKERLAGMLEGASLDAVDWAGGVLRAQIRSEVEKELPEFKAAVDLVEQHDQVVLQVVVYPVGEVVRRVQYEMLSRSIPNVLLINMKDRYAEKVNNLRGLPVSFVARKRGELESMFLEQLQAERMVGDYHLTPAVTLIPGVDLTADILVESKDYKIWFEGYGDIGRRENNLSGRAHVGRYFSPNDEIFAEAGVKLDDVAWDFSGGYAWHEGKTTLSYMRRSPTAENVYRAEYDFGPKWRLRYEYWSGNNVSEYAIRYRIHEFLSGEYVYSTDRSYFRIVGNL
jgi:hypothetical protein